MVKGDAMQTGKSNQDTHSDHRYNGFKNTGAQCDDCNAPETSRLPKTGSGVWESGRWNDAWIAGDHEGSGFSRPQEPLVTGSLLGQKRLVISEDVALPGVEKDAAI